MDGKCGGNRLKKGKGDSHQDRCRLENVQLVGCALQLVSPQFLGKARSPESNCWHFWAVQASHSQLLIDRGKRSSRNNFHPGKLRK